MSCPTLALGDFPPTATISTDLLLLAFFGPDRAGQESPHVVGRLLTSCN